MANAAANPTVDLHRTLGDRMSVLLIAVLLLMAFVILAVVAIASIGYSTGLFLFLLIPAAIQGACFIVVVNEARMRWGTHIILSDRSVRLRLPARRGYVSSGAIDVDMPLSAIKGIETRAEAFRSLGNTVIQQSYTLIKDDGSSLLLGGDRPWVPPFFGQAADAIAARAGVAIRDRGTVQGDAGFILLWGQKVPPWNAPPVAPAEADRYARQASRALYWVWIIVSVAMMIGALARSL
jgi:hypothetical protein